VVSPWVDTERDRNFFERELSPPEGEVTFAAFDSARDNLGGFSGGHGTRTLSVLCGFSESAAAKAGTYAGYYGAAPKAAVVPIRIEDTIWIQNALRESLPAAIDYLVNEAGVSVISLSMGSPKFAIGTITAPQALRDAIDNAYEKGVIFCCAAGNHVPDEKIVFPARCPRTIAVGGSAPDTMPWAGSSYGIQVDISAPAFPIRRANTRRGEKYDYGIGDGTSFATPLVAGTAAMWLVHRRLEIEQSYPEGWQRVAAFLKILGSTATPGADWNSSIRGPGILNAGAVLNAPLPDKATLSRDVAGHE
jgi:subtilisin family serine protease